MRTKFSERVAVRQVREEAQPLIPQYSLRWLLGLTTVCGVLFAILGMAVQGRVWAICVSVGLGTLVMMALLHAVFYGCIAILGALCRGREGSSPFRSVSPSQNAARNAAQNAAPLAVEQTPFALDGENPFEAEVVS